MSEHLSLLPYGQRALLIDLPSSSARRALLQWLTDRSHDGLDMVAAESTILLDVADPVIGDARARELLGTVAARIRELDIADLAEHNAQQAAPTTVEVSYDGPDLAGAAQALGMSCEALVSWHTDSPWTVEFLGFIPGFTYLTRADHDHEVDRLPSPRREVPAGSVGLAGPYCGIYPRCSPGGWQLIGHTDHVLFDTTGDGGATFTPADRLHFTQVR